MDWSKSRLVFSKLEIFKHVIFKTTSVTAELLYPAKKLDASNFSSDPIRNTSQKSGSLQKPPIPTMKKQIFLNCIFFSTWNQHKNCLSMIDYEYRLFRYTFPCGKYRSDQNVSAFCFEFDEILKFYSEIFLRDMENFAKLRIRSRKYQVWNQPSLKITQSFIEFQFPCK